MEWFLNWGLRHKPTLQQGKASLADQFFQKLLGKRRAAKSDDPGPESQESWDSGVKSERIWGPDPAGSGA